MAQSDPPSQRRIASTPVQLTAIDRERRRAFNRLMDGLRDTLEAGSFRKAQCEADFEAEFGFTPTPLLAKICKELGPATIEGRERIFRHVFEKLVAHYDEIFEGFEMDVHHGVVEDIAAQILSIPPTADSMLILEQVLGGMDVSFRSLAQRRIWESELGTLPDPDNVYITGARIGLAHASFATIEETDPAFDLPSAMYVDEVLRSAVVMPVPIVLSILENLGCQEIENLAGGRFVDHKRRYFYTRLLKLINEEIESRGGFCVFSANGERELAVLSFGGAEKGGSYSAIFSALERAFRENSDSLNVERTRQRTFGRLSMPTTSHLAEHLFSVRFMEEEVDLLTVDPEKFSPTNPAPFVMRLLIALEQIRAGFDYSYFYFSRGEREHVPFDCGPNVDPVATENLAAFLKNKREDHDMACDLFGARPNSYLHIRPFARLSGEALEHFRTESGARKKYQVLGEVGRVRLSALEIMLTQNEIDQLHLQVLEAVSPNAGILRRYSGSSYFALFRDPERRRRAMAGMVKRLKGAGFPGIQPELLVYEFEAGNDKRQEELRAAYDSVRLAKLLPFSVGFLGEPCTPEVFIVRGGAEEGEADSVSMFLARLSNYAWRMNERDVIIQSGRNPLISFLDKHMLKVRDKMVADFVRNTKEEFGIDLVDVLGRRPSNLDPYESIIQVHTAIRKKYGPELGSEKSKQFEQMLRKIARVCPMP